MPLKKKQRGSSVLEASTPIAQTPGETHHNDNATPKLAELDSELWTNEEEISLFKGMIRWKPVGMHKRFRMIALTQHMRQRGHFAEHTRAMGIRVKLDGLYNIKALDERENVIDDGDAEIGKERYCEFTLPGEEFYALMMDKRMDVDRGSSPGWLEDEDEDEGVGSGSGIGESDEAVSSRASSVRVGRGGRRGRGARGRRGGRGRGAKESTIKRRTKAESEASENSEEEEDIGEEEDEDGEDEEEDDNNENDHDEGGEEDVPTTRVGRPRGRGRGLRGRGRGRGRKRG